MTDPVSHSIDPLRVPHVQWFERLLQTVYVARNGNEMNVIGH
jgi:hypothetical protein